MIREASFNWQHLEGQSLDREEWRDFLNDRMPSDEVKGFKSGNKSSS